jgi:hypothetical protein
MAAVIKAEVSEAVSGDRSEQFAIYSALLGSPHTDQPYYVGYNIDGFEVALNPGDTSDGPVALADVEVSTRAAKPWMTAARRSWARRARSLPRRRLSSPTLVGARSALRGL